MNETIGERITTARVNRGWTQQQLSDEVGIGRPAINKIERGSRQVTALELVRIARLLKVRSSELLQDTTEVAKDATTPDDYSPTQPEPSRCPSCGSRLFKEYGCTYNAATDQGDQTGWHCLMCCTTFESFKVGKQIRIRVSGIKPVTLMPGELKQIRHDSARRTK